MDVISYAIGKKKGGITPTGEIEITQNGITNVSGYATANVDVATVLQKKSLTINSNTTTKIEPDSNYDGLEEVNITTNVPQPSGKITITQNGTDIDVSSYATADVNVPAGADLSEYFNSTISLGTSDLPSWQTVIKKMPNLTVSGTSLKYAFYKSPSNLIIPNIDVSNCDDLQNCFNFSNANEIDLSGWTFSNNYINFQNCFNNAKATKINMSSLGELNTNSGRANFARAFAFNTNLVEIDLSNFNVYGSYGVDGGNMFNGCTSLAKIDMSSLDFSKLGSNISYMFNSVPTNCLIYVKDQTQVDWFTTNYPSLTNVQIKS